MKGLYKFNFDCGRMGSLEGIFIEDTDKVKDLVLSGDEVYFGEVLGKHSEIYGQVEDGDVTLVTTDSKVIEVIEEHNLESGINPFDYIEED